MIGLLCVEDTISVCKAVTIEYRNVADRRTDGRTDRITISISRVSVLTADAR